MIHFKDLSGPKLKKALPVTHAKRRYHNQNKSGGNFGINLKTINSKKFDFELNGMYNVDGVVYRLSVSEMYQPGMKVITINNYDRISHYELFHKVKNYMN